MRHDHDVDRALAGRQRVDPRLDGCGRLGRAAVDQHPPRTAVVAGALDPDRVPVGGVQNLDRDCGSHTVSFARRCME